MSRSSSVQALYDLCKKTFSQSLVVPASSQAMQKICCVLDSIGPKDVGLKGDSLDDDRGHGFFGVNQFNRADRWAQPITYLDMHECDGFTMCIFCLPTSSAIPLHDHPGMTVLSKLLYGSMHVKAYDWVEPACIHGTNNFQVRLARLTLDNTLTAPCPTSIVYPKSGGNLHCFTAITPCAVLDVLAPPYRESAGRRCTYYNDHPYSSFEAVVICEGDEDNYVWLEEVDTPGDLYMRTGHYTGPSIQV